MDFTRAELISGADITKYSTLASLAFLLYDHVLTLDIEMEFIWSRKWSFGKALFLFNRYFGPFTLIFNVSVFFSSSLTDEFCTRFLWWETISAVIAVLSAEVILQARLYAVYDRNKKILAAMICLCIIESATMLTIDGLGLPTGFAGTNGLTGCYDHHVPSFYFTVWIPEILFETVLLSLMLYKAWRVYRNDSTSPLLTLLVRDSILYFFSFFAALMVNLLIWVAGPQQLAEVAVSWAVAVPCAMGSRLLLNMRERYFREDTFPSLNRSSRSGIELGFVHSLDNGKGKDYSYGSTTGTSTVP